MKYNSFKYRFKRTHLALCIIIPVVLVAVLVFTILLFTSPNRPQRIDEIVIGEVSYKASYYGTKYIGRNDIVYTEFWRLEKAYEDFMDKPKTGNWLPYDNYPMPVKDGQVFVIDAIMKDSTVERWYYRSDGNYYTDGRISTEEFTLN